MPGECTREATLDPGDLYGHSGQKPRARPEPARTIPCTVRAVAVQQPSTATTPGVSKHELPPTPSVNWDSGHLPSTAASSPVLRSRRGRFAPGMHRREARRSCHAHHRHVHHLTLIIVALNTSRRSMAM